MGQDGCRAGRGLRSRQADRQVVQGYEHFRRAMHKTSVYKPNYDSTLTIGVSTEVTLGSHLGGHLHTQV